MRLVTALVILFSVLLLVNGCAFGIRVPFVGVGVRVLSSDVDPGSPPRAVTTYRSSGQQDRLELARGRVWLNGVDHGPIQPGDEVRLTDETLWVNGEVRTPVVEE